jgi:hypothetical protein
LRVRAAAASTRVRTHFHENVALATVCDAMPTRCLGPTPWALAHGAALVDKRVLSVTDEQVGGAATRIGGSSMRARFVC